MGWCIGAALMATAVITQARAEVHYPNGPVTLIAPFAAGGTVDQVARALAHGLEKKWGTPVIVENKPGAGNILAATAVARAKPDGQTLLFATTNISVNAILFKTLPYDLEKGLAAVSYLAASPNVLVARPRVGVKTLRELIALAKKSPAPLQYASVGKGSAHHICMELFQVEAGVKLTHIAYKGVAPALRAVLSDEVELYCSDIPGAVEPIQTGKFIPLAVTGAKRIAALPNVPTMAEAGLPKYDNTGYVGIMTTGGTPSGILHAINRAIQVVIKEHDFQQRFSGLGYDMLGGTPEEFAAFIKRDIQRYRALAKAAGIQAE
jgi:tripartite-type tricarboxylate transporter receptor subunit TctC